MRNVLAILLALVLTTSFSAAATKQTVGTNLKNAIKQDVQSAKEAIKKDADNAEKQRKEANKQKKAAYKEKKDAQISDINKQITAKKQQIKDVQKSSTMTETEKNIRVKSYERQIEILEAKKDKINDLYEKNVKALK